ncbi:MULTISPECIES: glycosyltransferase family 4 protein [Roseibium]|uniref:glycosyltransferase family 4 protein n=1 Tax=Roseibium TaxID=150830 RepID=UPI0032658989
MTSEKPRSDFSDVRLVHIVRQYAPMIGGLEDFVKNMASRQIGRFRDVRVVTLDRLFTHPDQHLPQHETIDGIDVVRVPYSGSSRYPFAPSVFQEISDVDLIHVHAIDFFFDAFALSSLVKKRRLIATTHGGFFHTAKHSFLKKIWFNSVTRFSASRYDAIACCSDSDFELFRPLAPGHTEMIENGVDLDKFAGAASLRPQKRLLTLGRFSQNKRIDLVLDALVELRSQDCDWKLDIVGGPSDWSVSDIQEMIQARGLEGQAFVHVGLSDQGLRDLIGLCSFFVSASEYEGFGIAMIEALSAGLLPIVQPNSAFQSLSEKHPSVRLVDFTDAAAVAGNVENAWSELSVDPGRARQSAIVSAQQHSWDQTIARYDALYGRALVPTSSSSS